QRFEPLEMVIFEIGLEAGVHGGGNGDLALARPGDRAVADDVWAGDVHQVGSESLEITPDPARKCNRHAIFRAAWDRDRWNAHQIARRRERGILDGRRINADLDPLF